MNRFCDLQWAYEMFNARLVVMLCLTIGLGPTVVIANEAKNPLLGTWKLKSLIWMSSIKGEKSVKPLGEHPDGYLNYSLDGRMYAFLIADKRPAIESSVPSDEEKIELFNTMSAYAGTYVVEPNKVIHHVDISWNQSWTGTDQVRFYKIDGNALTITSAPGRSPVSGKRGYFLLTWDKVK